jgi:hypothetical protein
LLQLLLNSSRVFNNFDIVNVVEKSTLKFDWQVLKALPRFYNFKILKLLSVILLLSYDYRIKQRQSIGTHGPSFISESFLSLIASLSEALRIIHEVIQFKGRSIDVVEVVCDECILLIDGSGFNGLDYGLMADDILLKSHAFTRSFVVGNAMIY